MILVKYGKKLSSCEPLKGSDITKNATIVESVLAYIFYGIRTCIESCTRHKFNILYYTLINTICRTVYTNVFKHVSAYLC